MQSSKYYTWSSPWADLYGHIGVYHKLEEEEEEVATEEGKAATVEEEEEEEEKNKNKRSTKRATTVGKWQTMQATSGRHERNKRIHEREGQE